MVQTLAAQFPAVVITGARQCGKTTLARHFLQGTYFDLERPSDHQVFAGDIELALSRLGEPLILGNTGDSHQFFLLTREPRGGRVGACPVSDPRPDTQATSLLVATGNALRVPYLNLHFEGRPSQSPTTVP